MGCQLDVDVFAPFFGVWWLCNDFLRVNEKLCVEGGDNNTLFF
jgi:hypothetical protein